MTGNSKINYRQSKAYLDPQPQRSKLKTTRSSSSQPDVSTGVEARSSTSEEHAGGQTHGDSETFRASVLASPRIMGLASLQGGYSESNQTPR